MLEFRTWCGKVGLSDRTIQKLKNDDLDDFEALEEVCERDLGDLEVTLGMRALLKHAVNNVKDRVELKDEQHQSEHFSIKMSSD